MDKEIIEGNELIAKFMEIPTCDRCDCGRYKYGSGIFYLPEEIDYNTSWNWLMPVCKKIEIIRKSTEGVGLYQERVGFLGYGVINSLSEMDIEITYNACISFITFYNSKTQTNG